MRKRRTLVLLLVLGIGFLWQSHETKQAKLINYDSQMTEFARLNWDIQSLILESNGVTHYGQDELKNVIYNMQLHLQSLTKEMEDMPVPKPYKQAHEDLLHAYKDFLKVLTVYQKNAKKDDMITESNGKMIYSAYTPITQASDEWFAIYKERMVPKEGTDYTPWTALGSLQNQQFYIDNTQTRMKMIVGGFESDILPWVEKKDYGAIDKLLLGSPGRAQDLQRGISYMKLIKVPKAYTSAHQQLLNSYENYYNSIKDKNATDLNDEYIETIKSCYLDMKKASEEWNLVLQQQS
ncbi:hypothetical protein ABES03_06160 [Neobacillus rhizosphaerae]|uniref:hypothetical protein n=1 Tax=Neobacillus rhizosphaerae TaxID=2880965 RepID=UPI003D28F274